MSVVASTSTRSGSDLSVAWTLTNGDTGSPMVLGRNAFFQATGTFGTGGSVQLEGSNDGTNWGALSPSALTGAGLFGTLRKTEAPLYIRPHCTAGDGTTSIVVTAWMKQ